VKACSTTPQIHEEKLKDRDEAIKLYQELIDQHPKHDLASDARKRVKSLEEKK